MDFLTPLVKEFLSQTFTKALPLLAGSNLLFYTCYKLSNNVTFIDVGWAINHLLVGSYYFSKNNALSSWQGKLLFGLLSLYSIRLGGYLFKRVLNGVSDPRYELLTKKHKNKTYIYFVHFQIQAFLTALTSSTLFFTFRNVNSLTGFSWNLLLGGLLVIMGIIGEYAADNQLENFKKNKKKVEIKDEKNKILFQEGLWRFSRHPNLFFEFCIWAGFGVLGFRDNGKALAMLGPIILMLVVGGLSVPVTEKLMKTSRDEKTWNEYVKNTNKFFPFFKI